MKHFLAAYSVIDGEHTHVGRLLITARDSEEAWSFANSLAHDTDCCDGCNVEHPWSYIDGTTASTLSDLREISVQDFKASTDVIGLLTYDANA